MASSAAGSTAALVATSAHLPPPLAFLPSYSSSPSLHPQLKLSLHGIQVWRAPPVMVREEKMDSFRNGLSGLGKGLSPWKGVNDCL